MRRAWPVDGAHRDHRDRAGCRGARAGPPARCGTRPGDRPRPGAAGGVGRAGGADRPGRSDVAVAVDLQVDPQPRRRADPQGHPASARTVAEVLVGMGYSLQATSKQVEGAQHPDRDGQFRYINEQARAHLAAGQPVISVDTKKKEVVGNLANKGREWQPNGDPVRVDVHDFPDPTVGKAIPYGVYDLGADRVGSGSATTTTPPRSRWRRSAAGGRWWAPGVPAGQPAAGHRRCWRVQRLPQPAVEGRARQAGRRDRSPGHRVPLPAGHLQVEPDRAPPVLRTSR